MRLPLRSENAPDPQSPVDRRLAFRAGPPRPRLRAFEAFWPDDTLVATLLLGKGIRVSGEPEVWRLAQRDGIRMLQQPQSQEGLTLASFFVSGAGLFGRVRRATIGESRVGGYVLAGKGWRGGVLLRAGDQKRALLLSGEGDPPTVYFMDPVPGVEGPPFALALLVAYALIEREIREGALIPRPPSGAPDGPA